MLLTEVLSCIRTDSSNPDLPGDARKNIAKFPKPLRWIASHQKDYQAWFHSWGAPLVNSLVKPADIVNHPFVDIVFRCIAEFDRDSLYIDACLQS